MRLFLDIYVLALVFSLIQAKQKTEVQKPEFTKLKVANLSEVEFKSNFKQTDIQRKRDSGYTYNRPNRISSNARFRIQSHSSKNAFKIPGQLSRPFTQYGLPTHSTSGSTHEYHAQQHRNKLQQGVSQQQSISFGGTGLMEQELPSSIRNVDFTKINSIASQNNEPFGIHTANYLPPQNQKLPTYTLTNNFDPQNQGQFHDVSLQNQNLQTQNHQISDAAVFLSENAQAIQQLYGAPASNQDFAPNNDQFQSNDNPIYNFNNQFKSISQNSEEFHAALPSYASGTLNSEKTLEQIQSLEKDRLIIQLQQALAEAQINPSINAAGRYAQNQAGFDQNQELLASINKQVNSHIPTTPQSVTFGSGNTAFGQSTFLPGTTVNPLGFPINYGISTTTQAPTTTTGVFTTQSSLQPSKGDSVAQVSSQTATNQPVSSTTAGIPIYGGFVPIITGTNLVPSYSTSIFSSGSVKPETSPTHFGIPIPTETSQKPELGSVPSTPTTTVPPLSASSPNRPGIAITPAITSVTLPLRPVAPVATPVHPIAASLLPTNPAQVHPAQNTPAITSSVQHTYGVQTALINPILYKPVKTVYPIYYYPVNIAYQHKPTSSNYPWNYAPSYATSSAKIWK